MLPVKQVASEVRVIAFFYSKQNENIFIFDKILVIVCKSCYIL